MNLLISRYLDVSYRFFLSLVISVFFVYYGSEINFLDALLIRSFYISLAGNFVIAFTLISWIHLTNRWINKSIPWNKGILLRIFFALFLGFIVPALIAYFFAALYFYFFGIDIRETSYRHLIYPVILLMLFVLNACYSLYYYFSTPNAPILIPVPPVPDREISDSTSNAHTEKQKEYILANGNGQEIYLNVKEDVCYFYCLNNNYFVKTFDNKTYDVDRSLKELEETYSGSYFFRINRNTLLNIKAIHSFTIKKMGRAIVIHIKPEIYTGTQKAGINQFTVPREKVTAFKNWIDR